MLIIVLLVFAVIFLVIGVKGLKRQKAEKAAAWRVESPAVNRYEFVVAGILHHRDAVMSLADEEEDFGLSLKKLDEEHPNEKVFRYWFSSVPCSVVPEPENPVDPNALRLDVYGDCVGYVRAVDVPKVKAVMSGRFGDVESCSVKFEGGEYKLADLDDEGELVLVKDEEPIFGTLTVTVRPKDPNDVSPVILTEKDITL